MSKWYQQDVSAVLSHFEVDAQEGLTEELAARRLKEYGPNELLDTGGRRPWEIIWEQLRGPMILLLIVAAGISAYLDETADAIVILAIVVLNAVLGFFQEYRAEKAIAALKQLAVPHVRVRRNGQVQELLARELVPGDIVLLEAGNLVPADGRLVESQNLKVQEAALTGESVPTEKTAKRLGDAELSLGDRKNQVYLGTIVIYGRGQAVITETGMQTELGNIAGLLQSVQDEETPLQRRLAVLGKQLTVAAIGIVAVVFFLGLLQGHDLQRMFLTAISMAVAAVPEGLPAVATVTLALGARRMLRRNALIRRLPAVETLGSVTVICSDKTGTLTENRMVVQQVVTAGKRVDVSEGENPDASSLLKENPSLALVLAVSSLCNDAHFERDSSAGENNGEKLVGDPTESALVSVAATLGLEKPELEQQFPRIAELPFDSDRKRMSTVHEIRKSSAAPAEKFEAIRDALAKVLESSGSGKVVMTKGAVDQLLGVADRRWTPQGIQPLDKAGSENILAANDDLASRGVRVLGMAVRAITEEDFGQDSENPSSINTAELERNLIFLGMCGMIDPPRPEVAEAVRKCKAAGIRPVMITGDHPLTAQSIALDLGIGNDHPPITGQELAKMSRSDLSNVVKNGSVYARVSPEHKLRIVEALQKQGEIAAMTGDGVNDAPALKRADIGVAMGITGTDVSKEAADMVLVDDNFASIVNAVEEGRIIYDNIRKFILYTMTSNTGEIWVMLFPALLSLMSLSMFGEIALPLLPIQILWINLVTDGLPGLALALEPAERNTMARPPYPPGENFFGRGVGWHILLFGLLMGLVSFCVGLLYWSPEMSGLSSRDDRITYWRTIVFVVITLSQMGHVLSIRSLSDSIFRIGFFSNPPMLAAVALTFLLQFALVYVPPLQKLFHTTALRWQDMALCLAASTIVFWGVEAYKWWHRRTEDG